jgi:cytochrome P450
MDRATGESAVSATAARHRHPPMLRGWPAIGHLPQVGTDRLGLMMRAFRAHGEAVRIPMGPKMLYLFNHPDHVKRVLTENPGNYRKGLGQEHARRALGDGLLTSEGAVWKRQRKAVQPAFHRDRVAAATDVIVAEGEQALARWRRSPQGAVDLVHEMTQLTLGVLGHFLLQVDLGGWQMIGDSFEAVQEQAIFEMVTLNLVPTWVPLPRQLRFRSARQELAQLVNQLTAQRAGVDGARDDLLSRLLDSIDHDPSEQARQQLRDELVTLLLAGHETTASTLGWTWYLVTSHPQVAERLHAEAVAVLGQRRPTYADLAELSYTTRVVEEAMRLYPPVWMLSRVALDDDEVGGYHVPAGSDVLICTYTLHRNPRYWSDPERFDPDRFLPEMSGDRPRYAYLPFGAGPRVCVGSQLGLLEAVLLTAMIAREFRVSRRTTDPIVPEPMLSLRLRGGLPVTVTPI